RFSLDDFGSGMSSFAYLKSLPVDFLKIDGSLVKDMDHNKTDFCMVEAINKIAQEMGIMTIAEFVGNQVVIEKLQSIGVDFAQGYSIHQPEHLH
ncbi:MAG: EAL domain-containing protein, partial [Sulfurimicrobium sp.]|nr:EAL domain-containing protein [Sulfurimicrobium sp.]